MPAPAPTRSLPGTDPASSLWADRPVRVTVSRLVGGIPANPKLLDAWLEANSAPPEARADKAEMQALLAAGEVEQHTSAFARNAKGQPCYEARCFKAAFKEAANVTKEILGIKNARARLAEHVFVGPPLCVIATPIRVEERVIHVMTRMGPRDSIKRYEVTADVPLRFTLRVLHTSPFTWNVLGVLLDYMVEGGIGADRSQGAGVLTEWAWAD